MRILHITRLPITITAFLMPMLNEHRRRGDDVAVCCAGGEQIKIIKDKGFDCYIHNMTKSLNPFNLIRAFFSIRKIISQNHFDVVICHTPLISLVGRLAACSARVKKIIYFAHGLPCAPNQNRLRWLIAFIIEWFMGRFTDGLIVMNSYDENLSKTKNLIKNTENIHRVPGVGVDIQKFNTGINVVQRRKILDELDSGWAQKVILFAGRLIKSKGVYEYLYAAEEIIRKDSEVVFLIAGSGPEYESMNRFVDRLSLRRNIKILGWRKDINVLMSISDIFVLPSYYFEGLPVSILEAMACGKPVIAAHNRGSEDEVLDSYTGYLVKPKSSCQIVSKLNQILEDGNLALKLGKNARARVEKEYELYQTTLTIIDSIYKIIRMQEHRD